MDAYDTSVLIKVVENLKVPTTFLLDRWFPSVVQSDSESVQVDIIQGKRRMAPFVSPLVEGKVIKSQGVTTNIIKPAYIKDKRMMDPTQPLKRRAGERIGGAMSPAQREQAYLNGELQDQLDMLTRRLEFMAFDAVIDGKLVISGEGFPDIEVDFGRDNSLSKNLTLSDRWGETGVSPADDLEAWALEILKLSGATVIDIVFDTAAWKLFKADPKTVDAIETRRGGNSNIELGAEVKPGAVFKGTWGAYNLWVHSDWYVDANGTEQPFMPENSVLMGGPQIEGGRHFGAILDTKAGYRAMQFFPKSWVSEDPAVRWLMTQSAPLIVPHRPNASLFAQVRGS